MSNFWQYYQIVLETFIAIGVWLELYLMVEKRRRIAIKRSFNRTLRNLGLTDL